MIATLFSLLFSGVYGECSDAYCEDSWPHCCATAGDHMRCADGWYPSPRGTCELFFHKFTCCRADPEPPTDPVAPKTTTAAPTTPTSTTTTAPTTPTSTTTTT